MERNIRKTSLAIALVAFAAACDTTPSEPEFMLEVPAAENLDAELELATDPALAQVAMESAEARVRHNHSAQVRLRLAAARGHFAEARRRWQAGQPEEARRRGRMAREALADAMVTGIGTVALDGMIEETEATLATLSVDDDGVDAPVALASTLNGLLAQARTDRAQGAVRDGVEKMVRARQHTDRHVRRHTDRPDDRFSREERFRIQVAMGGEAVELAVRLVGPAPTDTQERLLETAAELQRMAEAAWGQGDLGRAAALAREAEITSLRAVIDTDGVGHDEAQAVQVAAEELLTEAAAAVEAGGAATDLALLELAQRLYAQGIEQLEAGKIRGLALIWHAANAAGVILP